MPYKITIKQSYLELMAQASYLLYLDDKFWSVTFHLTYNEEFEIAGNKNRHWKASSEYRTINGITNDQK